MTYLIYHVVTMVVFHVMCWHVTMAASTDRGMILVKCQLVTLKTVLTLTHCKLLPAYVDSDAMGENTPFQKDRGL